MADNVNFKSHMDEVLNAFDFNVRKGLEAVGEKARGHAMSSVPVDTGRLKNSIEHKVAEPDAVYIGTNVKYAIYVEFGTGIYADNGQGRKTPWAYQDEKGKWHWTKGIKAYHFLRDAVSKHEKEYKATLKAALRS